MSAYRWNSQEEQEAAGTPTVQIISCLLLIGLMVGIGLGSGVWHDLRRSQKEYATATGFLTQAGEVHTGQATKYRRDYSVTAEYSFQAGGREYFGNRMGLMGGKEGRSFSRKTDAEAFIQTCEQHLPITVRYDAADPTDNYTEPSPGDRAGTSVVWLVSLLTFALIGGAVLIIGWTLLKR